MTYDMEGEGIMSKQPPGGRPDVLFLLSRFVDNDDVLTQRDTKMAAASAQKPD